MQPSPRDPGARDRRLGTTADFEPDHARRQSTSVSTCAGRTTPKLKAWRCGASPRREDNERDSFNWLISYGTGIPGSCGIHRLRVQKAIAPRNGSAVTTTAQIAPRSFPVGSAATDHKATGHITSQMHTTPAPSGVEDCLRDESVHGAGGVGRAVGKTRPLQPDIPHSCLNGTAPKRPPPTVRIGECSQVVPSHPWLTVDRCRDVDDNE